MTINFLHRLHGYFDNAPAIWASQKLLNKKSPSSADFRLATSFLRQAASICPYDTTLEGLAIKLSRSIGESDPFAMLNSTTTNTQNSTQEVLNILAPIQNNPSALLEYFDSADSPLIRHISLAFIWQQGILENQFSSKLEKLSYMDRSRSLPFFAWALYALGSYKQAITIAENNQQCFLAQNLLAQNALKHSEPERCAKHWAKSLDLEPGQPHLIERLAQLGLFKRQLPKVDNHKVHILFYTYNKLETTLSTLQSLLASDIGPAKITLLNNGSTNFSPEEFDQGVQRTAQGRPVEVIHLPVNIGAPAARNWLYHLPQCQEAEYIVFLDDDILLPRHWLALYLQDFEDHPEICAVGPKGINPNPYRTIQYIYRYFQEVGEHKIRFTNNSPLAFDLGQYDGRRPCLSVMGCCHMFDRQKLDKLGVPDFDLRFTPSQVDDLERDIQIWKCGGKILYDGRVEVKHLQDAGSAAPKSESSWGHV